MHLSELQCGNHAEVVSFDSGERFYRQKLLAMGLTPGTSFKLIRVAPLGDPVEIQVRGYSLSLRKAEANILNVKKVVAACDNSK
ncbi:MAG: feoA [Gammaproteobacteria bacterium]|jgi:Fe2+ transport system protein FeoA|nr:feoA [Gammaproteobacteria bacterium]